MPVSSYTSNADGNTSLFPEDMAASAVNDGMRAVQADVRTAYNEFGWINFGNGSGTPAYSYVSANAFSLTGDATAAYHPQRRVKAVGDATGTIYGSIVSSDFAAGETTVEMLWDGDGLQSETITVYLGLPADGALPAATSAQIIAGLSRHLPITPYFAAQNLTTGNPGALKLPGGLIIRYGFETTASTPPADVTFAEPYTTVVHFIGLTLLGTGNYMTRVRAASVTGFEPRIFDLSGNGAPFPLTYYWLAIGR